ncbi:arginine-ornithine antiporter [Tetragenococcus halophilus subsp. flandriensis]|uniref:basic amino acid/polyamine antiporter n=1 Tax=Tetragenococcus halophilus TaxID=51669 RepID=UPI0023EA2121|nr:basic amino acid/polyamine antiporter [Tetragenococcus halophilus]GMA07898.1 arginine-ornithine antiporter [Tetragenococcus halophilus subsp. flandriensis]
MEEKQNKVGLIGLVALTVTSVVGGGVFNLMNDLANNASVGPVIIALVISGAGMGMFVMCLNQLTRSYPELDAGIYSFAEKGFGSFVGFVCALGYWSSIFLGNVAFGSLAFSALGYFFPIFGDGQNVYGVIGASIVLWGMHFLILKGSDFASKINGFITLAKLLPLGIFIVTLIIAFDYDMFTADFWGTVSGNFEWNTVFEQVRKAMVSVVWVFVGVEGAVVYSSRAKDKSTVAKATILSFALITSIYLLATVLSFAVLSRGELAELSKPAMAEVMESVVGQWGAVLINAGVVISVIGAWFACTMFSGEILYQVAKEKIFPKVFAKVNKNDTPVNALLLSNGLVQFFFFSLLINESAYNLMALLASSTMLVPYFFVSLSHCKLNWQMSKKINGQVILGIITSIYMGFVLYMSGFDYLLVTTLLFTPGILVFIWSRKENDLSVFTRGEKIGAIALTIGGILCITFIATGLIDIANM